VNDRSFPNCLVGVEKSLKILTPWVSELPTLACL
jgi:hypothetical protein